MTTTDTESPATFDTPAAPDYIEHLLRARGYKLLFWNVGDPFREDEEDPNTAVLANFTVVFTNGKRLLRSTTVHECDVIYGLVSSDEITLDTAGQALGEILHPEAVEEFGPLALPLYEADESFAKAISEWKHSDADLVRQAAANAPEGWAELLETSADIVGNLAPGASLATPEAQLAAVAVKIAWELL